MFSSQDSFGADPIIAAIMQKEGIFQYEPKPKSTKWVSEGMQSELNMWDLKESARMHPPTLINAKTGAGKSHFTFNSLADFAAESNKKILVLSNRWALTLQQKIDCQETDDLRHRESEMLYRASGEPRYGIKILDGLLQYDNILIATYQEIPNKIQAIREKYPFEQGNEPIAFVVFDEAHFFCSDSLFNPETSSILRTLLHEFYCSRRIYMTATPEDVRPIIAFEETRLYQISVSSANRYRHTHALQLQQAERKIVEYQFSVDYSSRVQLYFFSETVNRKTGTMAWPDIIEAIKQSAPDEKWLLFVSKSEVGMQLKKDLAPLDVEFVDASYRETKSDEIMQMAALKCFPTKILITTSFLYNGVTLKDPQLKNIAVDYADRTAVIQALGRKRLMDGEKVNLYLKVHTESELQSYKSMLENQYFLTQKFRENPSEFMIRRWGTLPQNQMRMFQLVPYAPFEFGKSIQDAIARYDCLIYARREQVPTDQEWTDYQLNMLRSAQGILQCLEDAYDSYIKYWSYSDKQHPDLQLYNIKNDVEKQVVRLAMSDYAPHQLAQLVGKYENFINQIVKNGKQSFQEEVCSWFGLEYDESMDFAKPQREERKENEFGKAKAEVIACIDKYKGQPITDRTTVVNLVKQLKEVMRRYGLKTEKNFGGKGKEKSDINKVLAFFSLGYTCEKGEEESNTWTFEPIENQAASD